MAWQLLAAALPAAAKTVGTYLNKPDQDDYKPQTDYMKKYLSYLRGRQANKEVMHMAMQPQLRAVGQQGRQMQQQVGYDVAKTGLTGSGIEAQMRLSAGQKTQQALSTATEKAVAAQTAETARLGEKAADVEARIGAEEQRSEQAFKTATSQWKKQLAGDIIGLGASVASAGIQQGVANKGAYQQAVAGGQFEGSYDDFKAAATTGELPSLTGEGVDTVGRVSPSEYVQLRGARQQVVSQIAFSEEILGENVVKEYLEKGWSRQQIYEEASNQKTFERSVMNKIAINASPGELKTAVSQITAGAGAGTVPPAAAGGDVTPATDVSDALQTIGGVPPAGAGTVPAAEDMRIKIDEGGKKVEPFDPESSKYNEHYGDLIGLKPATEAEHRGSVAEDLSHLPENIQAQVKKELGDDVLLVLKGRKHETWDLAVEGEKKEGRKIVKGAGGYYYSVPDKKVETVSPVKKPETVKDVKVSQAVIDAENKAKRDKLVKGKYKLKELKMVERYEGEGRVRLAEPMADKFAEAFDTLKTEHDIELQVQDTYRHPDSQRQSHEKYLKDIAAGKNVPKVATADTSFHTIGFAFDLAQTDYMKKNINVIKKELAKQGLVQHDDEWWHFSLEEA